MTFDNQGSKVNSHWSKVNSHWSMVKGQKLYTKIAEAIKRAMYATMKIRVEAVRLAEPPSAEMGDTGFPCFELAGLLKKNPADVAAELAGAIAADEVIKEVRALGPYLNFFIRDEVLFESVVEHTCAAGDAVGESDIGRDETVVLEYLSPNTNKPLHIGHVRNACLGDAIARILGSQGWRVVRAQIINDRGAHICKSMLMYQTYGEERAPDDPPPAPPFVKRGVKPDHFVGQFYERFEHEAAGNPTLHEEVQEMLRQWEKGDRETRALWKKMNDWVYEGWKETTKKLGIADAHDCLYYESDIYEKGKEVVQEGLARGIFYRRDDGAVEIDLTGQGLDKKVLLRTDGTSVYITQDLYLARLRADEYKDARVFIYVVGKDQEYHLSLIHI